MKKILKSVIAAVCLFALILTCMPSCLQSEYTVTFVFSNGDDNLVKKVPAYGILEMPETPKKENFEFSGWYSDSECKSSYKIGSLVTSDLTLFAGWVIDYEAIVNSVTGSAMSANVKIKSTHYESALFGYTATATSVGSGAIYKKGPGCYYLLTNNHVVAKAEGAAKTEYTVYDIYGNEYEGELLASSPECDLAIMRFECVKTLTVLEISDRVPSQDELLISLGQPGGQFNALSLGRMINYAEVNVSDSESKKSNVDFKVFWHTAPSKKGSSGGALIDASHKLVAINFATGTATKDGTGYTFSIPAARVIEFLVESGFR